LLRDNQGRQVVTTFTELPRTNDENVTENENGF